ncbi:hypothetical protein SLNWT_2507 [Streptomyces albus]|uniref:Uncharacterized protein n=1 Tax=Streptomyces albus (strain ATCC 21838 / DSM 41398 / FERM P-419 / JCM 4703 / NBRC 107858) TaxID=1081613 RepID=A0A0B5EKS2_STRA4|nr:hypothetical protein SLNWT_2507 [Streptomyces albus]AOU77194.1 hypothetical protein SLNHY_2503 [Streptomyces albus]AYN32972.1 hypothetical protein DUI70_2470 [Streptomyces albus]
MVAEGPVRRLAGVAAVRVCAVTPCACGRALDVRRRSVVAECGRCVVKCGPGDDRR